jgi:uncharacterized protein YbcI
VDIGYVKRTHVEGLRKYTKSVHESVVGPRLLSLHVDIRSVQAQSRNSETGGYEI